MLRGQQSLAPKEGIRSVVTGQQDLIPKSDMNDQAG